MNEQLKEALDNYFILIKDDRPNYRVCYNCFLDYCNRHYPCVPLKDLFERKISLYDIKQACKIYITKSKKAKSIEAVQRFLTAIDMFYKFLEKDDIFCKTLKNGCRKKEVVHDICISLNEELEQKIYLPFENCDELKLVEEQLGFLSKENFFHLGQSIIYRLLITYGFKEKIITNIKITEFDDVNGTILINNAEEYSIHLKLRDDIFEDLKRYCTLHRFPERVYLFTKSNGAQLTADSIFGTLKERMKKLKVSNFTPTSIALQGVSNLIEKGFTLEEIKALTGFETQKIDDVSKYLLTDVDVEKVINGKLSK